MKSKEVNYFSLFIEAAQVCERAACKLEEMMLGDVGKIPDTAHAIHEMEHEGDELYHTLYYHLNRAFITPIEREDILLIAKNIEDAMDVIDEAAIAFDMLFVRAVRPEAKAMARLISQSCEKMVEATREFEHFKKSKHLAPLIVDINHIEEDGDRLYQSTIKGLFANERDAIEVLKWKNIFDTLENILDACENVADTMENVILKNS